MSTDAEFRKHILNLLGSTGAHVNYETAISQVPVKFQSAEVEGVPYTLWQLLEHIRLAQQDILEYLENPHYEERSWPDSYWPKSKKPPTKNAWKESVAGYLADLQKIRQLINDPNTDLLAQLPHGKKGHTILRGILLAADHTAYHLGQMVLLMRILGSWKEG